MAWLRKGELRDNALAEILYKSERAKVCGMERIIDILRFTKAALDWTKNAVPLRHRTSCSCRARTYIPFHTKLVAVAVQECVKLG